MIGPILLLLAQGAAPAAAPAPSEEAVAKQVVAIGKTMDKWKGGIYKKDGKLTCRIEQSSGDQAVDLLRCGSMVGVIPPGQTSWMPLPHLMRAKRNRSPA